MTLLDTIGIILNFTGSSFNRSNILEIIGLSQGKPKGRLYIGKRKERGGL